ncbi:MAG: nucleotidyltransferase [Bacteroidetes bacterium]|nr:nucleotidyltransferase [Bacteroidota bacterium]
MPISETQLETWAHQGAVAQSKDTYATIRAALQDSASPYAGRSYDIFLQGSYCNDTNVCADSDVDVVMKLNSIFYHDISDLPAEEQELYNAARSSADYSADDFKIAVFTHLARKFPSKVTSGNKAIYIDADGNRRETDVVPCVQFRRYFRFRSWIDNSYVEGITFWSNGGTQIINYPKQHSENCTKKHQATAQWFKPTVRILKNMRNSMISKGHLAAGIAPSYFLEGMLYNVPNSVFGKTYQATVVNAINWVIECPDRSKLVCANDQYYLLREGSPVTWRAENLQTYLDAVVKFWDA